MNSLITDDATRPTGSAADQGAAAADPVRPLDWRRLKGTASAVAMTASLIAALGQAFGTVVAGWLADHATAALVGLLAACLLGSGVLDAVGRLIWAGVVDRAEGGLRTDLLTATMRQPVEALTEQAVGEILDRVDDDTHELGNLSREIFWRLAQTVFAVPALYVVAGVSWWPAWVLFPIAAVLTFVLIRGPLREIGLRKVLEEAAWTDHAAALEEAVAGRDDLRTSLGQAHAIRRLATLSALIHRRFADVVILEGRTVRRSGLMLHCLLVATVIIGVGMVSSGGMSVSELVTVFLAATLFVGQVDQASR
ncbi:ABC transporter transmembrane domain-containing protein [Rudaeicoccus suwonensis]|uniref:ABC transporter transmembrane domain-containing protein n=1 Tax=Rudaeicoccus suwonensis TaxID=657409 RepID=UPI001FE8ED69|nr:ABC transporter transmembrane domain-containing protein [Rudaeicoccus suwonensis]